MALYVGIGIQNTDEKDLKYVVIIATCRLTQIWSVSSEGKIKSSVIVILS
jgi:hypothetical protein